MAVVGTQPNPAVSQATIRPPQPQACELLLTTLNSKCCTCTWAMFQCVPKLPVAIEKESPGQPCFPSCTSIFTPAARGTCHLESCKKIGRGEHHPWLYSCCTLRNSSLLLHPRCGVLLTEASWKGCQGGHFYKCHCTGPLFLMEAMM